MVPTVPFSAAAETSPTSPDHVHGDGSQPLSVTAAAVAASSNTAIAGSAVASISFDDGPCADEQSKIGSNLISFSPRCEGTSQRHAMKRKSKIDKRAIEMREEQWNDDGWAWRKYGKKSIKGSPYPRNYYRCSTKKDCLARKQVERSVTNTSSFIVSYLGDHLHPQPTHLRSLAGTVSTTESSRSDIDFPEQAPAKSMVDDGTEMDDEDVDELIKNYLVMFSYKSIF